jgi:thioester reductase-like protein
VGAHLLASLLRAPPEAKVFALVRAADEPTALERWRSDLAVHSLWDDAFGERLSVAAGDLAEPDLGIGRGQWDRMATSVDSIVHCGAMVDFLRSYGELRSHNVTGTVEIAKLAIAGVAKEIHYISTISSFDPVRLEAEPEPLFDPDMPISGYLRSKVMAEHLVASLHPRGLRTTIYRLAEVGPGDGEIPNEKSFLTLLFWSCLLVG